MDNVLGELGTRRGLALTLSVLYHGLSCLADTSVPAKSGTVIDTAKKFELYLEDS
jgi:hypothetical protein